MARNGTRCHIFVKALTVWDPWAWLIRVGLKGYETRSWGTSYRGPLFICAAKRPIDRTWLRYINEILRAHGHASISIDEFRPGHAVALVDLTQDIICNFNAYGKRLRPENLSDLELRLGDFSRKRHALKLENIRAIEPFPVTGRQGLFEVEVPNL